jgi:hypothetical protein
VHRFLDEPGRLNKKEKMETLAEKIFTNACSGMFPFIGTCIVLFFSIHLICRFFRFLNIMVHGWPPPHIDADGDFGEDEPANVNHGEEV